MKTNQEIRKMLREPTPKERIKFRVGYTNRAGNKACMLAYVDARYVQDRLDDVVGADNWNADYEYSGTSSLFCTITVHWPDGKRTKKTDVGVETDVEKEKGQASDAFKRAAVHYGIGRDLYGLGDYWADCNDGGYVDKNWTPPGWLNNVISTKEVTITPSSHPEPPTLGPGDPGDENIPTQNVQEFAKEVTDRAAEKAPDTVLKEETPPEKELVMVSNLEKVRETDKAILYIPGSFTGDKNDSEQTKHFWLAKTLIVKEEQLMNGRAKVQMQRWAAESPLPDGSPRYMIDDDVPF